jgi:hypothetical protein
MGKTSQTGKAFRCRALFSCQSIYICQDSRRGYRIAHRHYFRDFNEKLPFGLSGLNEFSKPLLLCLRQNPFKPIHCTASSRTLLSDLFPSQLKHLMALLKDYTHQEIQLGSNLHLFSFSICLMTYMNSANSQSVDLTSITTNPFSKLSYFI